MARIAPKDLSDAIAAAKPGDRIELDSGEHVGQVVIDKPLVIEGRGASTWLGNRTGPVLIIRCAGVELVDLQIEMTGDLPHPAVLAEDDCEPALRNVVIRGGELHAEGPLLSFAAPPPIRLREAPASAHAHAPAAASLEAPPAGAITTPLVQPAASSARAKTSPPVPPPTSMPASSPSPARSSVVPMTLGAIWSARGARLYAAVGIAVLALCGLVCFAVSGSTPRSPAPRTSDPDRGSPGAAGAGAEASSPAPSPGGETTTPDELRLASNLRTNLEVVGWSQDEESFALEITYGRDSSDPARWRVRALVDAPSERVLKWQDLSAPPARVVAGEDERPPWSKEPELLQIDDFKSGSVIEPSQLEVHWCSKWKAARFPASVRPLGRELELTWGSRGEQLPPAKCRDSDSGQLLLYVKDSPWRLMRFLPWKGSTSTVRVHRSPSGRRAVVVAVFRTEGKMVTRFYSRLLGPQIHIVSNDPDLRSEALRLLGTPGLFMSENARNPIPPPSRILVRAEDEEALQVALSLQERLQGKFNLADLEKVGSDRGPSPGRDAYLWGDILIVLR